MTPALRGLGKRLAAEPLARAAASGAVLAAVFFAVGIVQIPLLLNHFDKQTAGLWLLCLTFGSYLALFDLGVAPTILREVSFIVGRGGDAAVREGEMSNLVATARLMYRCLALGVLVIGGTAGYFAIRSIVPAEQSFDLLTAWGIFAVGAAINVATGWVLATLGGLGHIPVERLLRAGAQLLGLVAMAVALQAGYGVIALAVIAVGQSIVLRIAAHTLLRRLHPALDLRTGHGSWARAKALIPPSMRWAAMSLGSVLILQTDNVVIAWLLGAERIPAYEGAGKMAFGLTSVASMLAMGASPYFSRSHAADDIDGLRRLLLKNTRVVMLFTGFCAAVLAMAGGPIIHRWLGADNYVGDAVLWALLGMAVLEVHHRALAIPVLATGRVMFLGAALAAAVLNIVLSIVLATRMGLLGVALGTLIAQLLTNNWYVPYTAFRLFKLDLREYAVRVVLPFVAVFGVTAGVILLVR